MQTKPATEQEDDVARLKRLVSRLGRQQAHIEVILACMSQGIALYDSHRLLLVGNRRYTDKKLLKEASLSQGEALNIYLVQEARRKVEEFYRSKGYAQARVSIVEGDKSNDRRDTRVSCALKYSRISSKHEDF